jgi:lysophospholipase L1-like esterase
MRFPPSPARLPRLLASAPAAALALVLSAACLRAADGHWVTTWACAPQLTETGNLPPAPLAHNTLRQFLRVSIGGSLVRVRFSNAYGTSPVSIQDARLALGAGLPGSGEVDTATDRPLRFRGAPAAVLPPGSVVFSDPVDFDLPALARVAISVRFGHLSNSVVTGHPGSRTTSFIKTGDAVSSATLPGAAATDHWYVLTGLEVMAPMSGQTVVVLGDSITDGNGTTTNGDNRWPDFLAQRLVAQAPAAGVAIANMGIGGNGMFGGLGPSAQNRFSRDVLGQNGARWAIFFIGVNDLGGSSDASAPTTASNLIAAYTNLAGQARAKGLKVYGATITPFGGNSYYSVARENARQTVNSWIRTTAVDNGVYDAFIDFDAAVRDPATPVNLLPAYDKGDHLHLRPTGYEAMADAIDLGLFTP